MAFGKQPTAEELLGMKPEDLKAKLDGAASKADVDKLTADIAGTASTLSDIRAALAALSNRVPEPVVSDPDPGDPTTQVLTDPEGYVRRTVKPLLDANLETQAQINELRARQDPQLASVFTQYPEIASLAAKFPVAQRAQEHFWQGVIRTYVGDKVIKGEIRENNFPSLLGSSSVAPTATGADDPNRGLSKPMADFFKDRNIPLDRAAKIQQLMRDGEPISAKTYHA